MMVLLKLWRAPEPSGGLGKTWGARHPPEYPIQKVRGGGGRVLRMWVFGDADTAGLETTHSDHLVWGP